RRIVVHEPIVPDTVTCTALTRRGDDGSVVGDLRVTDAKGALIAELFGVTFGPITARMLERLLADLPDRAAPAVDLARLREAGTDERAGMVLEHLVRLMAGILGSPPEDVEPRQPVTEFADSLMLAELKTAVERDLGV